MMDIIGSAKKRQRRGVSPVIGGVLVLVIGMTVLYGYFYSLTQSEQRILQQEFQNDSNFSIKGKESITVAGALVGPALGIVINNTGVSTIIISYQVIDRSTNSIILYNTGASSSPALPYQLSQSQSIVLNTGFIYPAGKSYSLIVLTSRGTTGVGTYPPRVLQINAINSIISSGLGALTMNFSSYAFYTYTQEGGPWQIDISHRHPAAYLPYGTDIVISLQIKNTDPAEGTVTIDPHSELTTFEQCASGCGTFPSLQFYVTNMAPNGTVTSVNQGSFVPIKIPYGASQTLYFGSSNDLSLGSYQSYSITGKANPGVYDIFLIASGTDTRTQNATLFGQNLPFADSYVVDNLAWFSETPTSCTQSSRPTFSLNITNSQFSNYNINKIVLNSSQFTSVIGNKPNNQWNNVTSSGLITWIPKNNPNQISPGTNLIFTWSGVAPPTIGLQTVFVMTIYFTGGTVSVQQSAVGCYIT